MTNVNFKFPLSTFISIYRLLRIEYFVEDLCLCTASLIDDFMKIWTAFAGLNRVGLKRNDFSQENIEQIKKITRLFFQDKKSMIEIQNEIDGLGLSSSSVIKQFLTFIENSSRGVTRKIRDQLR